MVSEESAGSTTPEEVSLLVKCARPAYAVSVFPYWSCALRVTLKAAPAVGVVVLAEAANFVALAARTVTVSAPVMLAVALSVAVIVCTPALIRVAENVP